MKELNLMGKKVNIFLNQLKRIERIKLNFKNRTNDFLDRLENLEEKTLVNYNNAVNEILKIEQIKF